MSAAVDPGARYSGGRECPVCGGTSGARRKTGTRCHGYTTSDRAVAFCGRIVSDLELPDGLHRHFLFGRCGCGVEHNSWDDAPPELRERREKAKANGSARPNGKASNVTPKPWNVPDSDVESVHPYTDPDTGALLFELVRFTKEARERLDAKTMPRHRIGDRWYFRAGEWAGRSDALPLYRQREAVAELVQGGSSYIAEGEADVDAIHNAGHVACCNAWGAGKFRDHHAATLARALKDGSPSARLVIVVDQDGDGRRHAADVLRRLRAAGAPRDRVCVVKPATGKDADDHLGAGLCVDDFEPCDVDEEPRDGEQEHAEDANTDRENGADPETRERTFAALHEGAYRLTVPEAATTLSVDFLRRDGAQLKGELLVRCDLPGAQTYDGILSIGDLNLSATRSRESLAKYLAERSRAKDLDWTGILEEFAARVLAAERDGAPSVLLGEMPLPKPTAALDVDGFALLERHATILFGDGGTAKSYLALYAAGTLARRGLRVAFFDWELSGEDHRDRLERLFGGDLPAIHYVRCLRPLHYEADRLRRIARDHAIDFAILDSIAFACDGPPEAAEVAGRYFQALRQLGEIGTLNLAHITKALEGADRRPFGSTFWHNGARSTWNVKLAEGNPGDSRITIGLYHRKANLGPLLPAVGFEMAFEQGRTSVRSVDLLSAAPDLSAALPLRQRMVGALRSGALPIDTLAADLGAEKATVQRTVRRYKTMFRVLDGGLVGLAR